MADNDDSIDDDIEVPEADRLDQQREVPGDDAPVPPSDDRPVRPEDQRAP